LNAFLNNYQVTVDGILKNLGPQSSADWKKALAEMEIGVRVTEAHAELQSQIESSLQKLAAAEKDLNASCEPPDTSTPLPQPAPPARGTIWDQLKTTQNPEVTGIFRTLATAYQSCDVLKLSPVTAATPTAEGISVIGNHPAGGLKRSISNLAQLVATHYYIKNQKLAKDSCFEVRKSPMIYDFGGKPYTSANLPNELNMFKDGGSGTSVLGIDCSAFVFSSLALAGLKLDPDPKKVMKADLVHGVGSGSFKEPQSNGLRCLEKINITKDKTLIPGDIVAINGHVQIIDSVGADPFGLAKITSQSDCNSSKVLYGNFDFVLAQSSPSKGGLGINRYQARDYLKDSSTFRDGLTRYAIAACRAKFGASSSIDSPSLSVVRHKKTADCRVSPLVATNQACVDSCPSL
jgi:hypothetical protein